MKTKLASIKRYSIYFLLGIIAILSAVIFVMSFKRYHTAETTSTPSATGTANMLETVQITPGSTLTDSPQEPTPTLTITPDSFSFLDGVWLTSLFNGKNHSIHAFHPGYLELTELFPCEWDELEPSLSPDGKYLAYRSNADGFWDIHVRNISTSETINITQSERYDGAPSWSPDGQWIVYETYDGKNFDLLIQHIADLASEPIQLTADPADDHSPSWSPLGREIVFVSNRSGNDDLWLARFDYLEDERFVNITNSPDLLESKPVYSPSGSSLLYVLEQGGQKQIVLFDISQLSARVAGFGFSAYWKYDETSFISQVQFANAYTAAVYSADSAMLSQPLINLPSELMAAQWISPDASRLLYASLRDRFAVENKSSESNLPLTFESPTEKEKIVRLDSVSAPYAFIAESAEQPFSDLRKRIGEATGWDFLANLESAYTPITDPPDPGLPQDWLFTGRAIALNTLPMQAEWMTIQRENVNGQIYWRIWVKSLNQDGSLGVPIKDATWCLDERFSGSTVAYENGGAYCEPPDGYWVDVTSLALENHWYRLPALSSWRTYYSAARYNILVFGSIDNWTQAMLRIYPPEALSTPTPLPGNALGSGTLTLSTAPTKQP